MSPTSQVSQFLHEAGHPNVFSSPDRPHVSVCNVNQKVKMPRKFQTRRSPKRPSLIGHRSHLPLPFCSLPLHKIWLCALAWMVASLKFRPTPLIWQKMAKCMLRWTLYALSQWKAERPISGKSRQITESMALDGHGRCVVSPLHVVCLFKTGTTTSGQDSFEYRIRQTRMGVQSYDAAARL